MKFEFYFHLESQEQSNEQMIMKCTNLTQQDNRNSDDDNQDSKKKKNMKNKLKKTRAFFFVSHFSK